MILFRAIFQADRQGHCRRMTFAAQDQNDAERTARDWIIGRELPLIVAPIRQLQPQMLQLTLKGTA